LELQPADAVLVGLDEQTAIVRESTGRWKVLGPGNATVYRAGAVVDVLTDGAEVALEEVVTPG
jgi:cyanophycinase-like exopeptidase